MKIMEILLTDAAVTSDRWYDDEPFGARLSALIEDGQCLQCRYKDRILILTKEARAVFDGSGNMLELYDLGANPLKNLTEDRGAQELAFNMILLLSRFNMKKER